MNPKTVRNAYILLGLMTLVSFGGPFLIGSILRGGESRTWPPDRPVEWVAFGGLTAAVVGLILGMGILWASNLRHLNEARRSRLPSGSPAPSTDDRGAA